MPMAETGIRNGVGGGGLDVRAADVRAALARRNPHAPDDQVAFTARLMAEIGGTIQSQELRRLRAQSSEPMLSDFIEMLLIKVGAALAREISEAELPQSPTRDESPPRLVLAPRGAVEVLEGAGFGERISVAESRERLAAYAEPATLEAWAGPLAGATELARRLKIPRSTLQDWRRCGAVIGLLKGTRKHVFPLAQFVDGRPLKGLAEVVAVIEDRRTAWLWLTEPDQVGTSRLADLKSGRIEAVLAAAQEDFA